MIDLAAAHRQLDAILGRHGVGNAVCNVEVSVFNHREPDASLSVRFSVSAHPGGEVVLAWQRDTLDDAFADFEQLLVEHLRLRTPPPAPAAAADLRVALPGELPGADGGPVEAAAIAASEADAARAESDRAAAGQHEDLPF